MTYREMARDEFPCTLLAYTGAGRIVWCVTLLAPVDGPAPLRVPPLAKWEGERVHVRACDPTEFLLALDTP